MPKLLNPSYILSTDFTELLMSPTIEHKEKHTSTILENYEDKKILDTLIDTKANLGSELLLKNESGNQNAEIASSSKLSFKNEATASNNMPINQNSMKQEEFLFETKFSKNLICFNSETDKGEDVVEERDEHHSGDEVVFLTSISL